MPKLKQHTHPPKKQKTKGTSAPQTASEFQEAADFEEATGGKWRAGDAAKSGRAFVRALDLYDRGLQRHPSNFDLAYNKARLQLEITQQPSLVSHIGVPLTSLLQQTLDSHRYALRINAENPDILFNTAQVLITLGELLVEEDLTENAVRLLQESLELLSACLALQETMLEQERADAARFMEQLENEPDGGVPLPAEETLRHGLTKDDDDNDNEGDSATVEMPVTPNDILDTAHASMSALIAIVPLVDQDVLPKLGEMAQSLTETKTPTYIAQLPEEQRPEAVFNNNLDRATFVAAFAEAQFQYQLIDVATYASRLSAFDFPGKAEDFTALSTEGEARQELATSILSLDKESPAFPANVCWRQLTLAQDAFAKAAKIESSPQVYQSRGDVEMYRHRLVVVPAVRLSEAIRSSAQTLMQNAQTYYRSAAKLSGKDDVDFQVKIEARMAVATALRTILYNVDTPELPHLANKIENGIVEMVDDGLLDEITAEAVTRRLHNQ